MCANPRTAGGEMFVAAPTLLAQERLNFDKETLDHLSREHNSLVPAAAVTMSSLCGNCAG